MATPTRPVVLITGANTGLGYEAVKALWLSSQAYTIIVAGRSAEKVASAITQLQSAPSPGGSVLEALTIDISSDASIEAAVSSVSARHAHIDALVNNAGGWFGAEPGPEAASASSSAAPSLGDQLAAVRASYNRTFDLNVSSAHAVTHAFMPLLINGTQGAPRLVFVTSGMASLAEEVTSTTPAENRRAPAQRGWPKETTPTARGLTGYRISKAGMNMMFLDWHRSLAEDGVKCFNVSPGFLATNFGGNPEAMRKLGALDPKVGGEFLRDVIMGKRDGDAGYAIRRDSIQPW